MGYRTRQNDVACYLIGVEGAEQKACSSRSTEWATKFECFPLDCKEEPEVTRLRFFL